MQGINNIFSSLMGLIKNVEVFIPDSSQQFVLGQQLDAHVISEEGNMYLIQTREQKFYAHSQTPLALGQRIKLYVAGQKDGRTWLKILGNPEEDLLQVSTKGEQSVKEGNSRNATQIIINKPADMAAFQPGLKYSAHVISREGETYILQIAGEALVAKGEGLLEPGKSVTLMVLKNEGDTVVLQSAETEEMGESIKEKIITVSKGDNKLDLLPGQRLEAVVADKNGNMFILKTNSDILLVTSDKPLQKGERLELFASQEDDNLVLWLVQEEEEQGKGLVKLKQALKRYGATEEREVSQVREHLQKIPIDEKTAVRYLLDPHLLSALLLPMQPRKDYNRVEIGQYKSASTKQNIYEVVLNLEMDRLGHLEIVLKMIDGKIYSRIWSSSADTESILRQNQEELSAPVCYLEIVPVSAGPLVVVEQDDLDLRI